MKLCFLGTAKIGESMQKTGAMQGVKSRPFGKNKLI